MNYFIFKILSILWMKRRLRFLRIFVINFVFLNFLLQLDGSGAAVSDSTVSDVHGGRVRTADVTANGTTVNNAEAGSDVVTGGILLNSGRRVGLGLKLGGLVHFAEEVDGEEEWRMSVQSSAFNSARRGVSDSPYENIFQLRQALNPTFPVDFDSATTTPGLSTPYIPSPYTPYVPIDTAAVVIVLNSLEEKCEEESEEEGKDEDEELVETVEEDVLVPAIIRQEGVKSVSMLSIPPVSIHKKSLFLSDSNHLPVCDESSNTSPLLSSNKGGVRSRRTF